MTTWAVIATGESLKPDPAAVVARVRHLPCVAVGNAYELVPWAKAVVACDLTWWQKHPQAKSFPGEKWSANTVPGVQRMRGSGIYSNTNSGLLGLMYAVGQKPECVLLIGIDMRGTHYFGPYVNGCKNTEPSRFEFFIGQFADYAKRIPPVVEVVNCNPDSALDVFPKMTLDEALGCERMAA